MLPSQAQNSHDFYHVTNNSMARDKRQSFFSSEFNLTTATYITPNLIAEGVPLSYPSGTMDPITTVAPPTVDTGSQPEPITQSPETKPKTGVSVLCSPTSGPFKVSHGFREPRPKPDSFPSIHGGLDLGFDNGIDLYACATGKVSQIFNDPGCDWVKAGGTFVLDSHGRRKPDPSGKHEGSGYGLGVEVGGFYGAGSSVPGYSFHYFYFHMSAPPTLNGKPVKIGDTVNIGDHVGFMGETGLSIGVHLHFQIEQHFPVIDKILQLNKTLHLVDPRNIYTAVGKSSEFVAGGPP